MLARYIHVGFSFKFALSKSEQSIYFQVTLCGPENIWMDGWD